MKEEIKKINGGVKGLRGDITVPGDKSITHRAIIFSSIAEGKSRISGISLGMDCLSTVGAFKEMGIKIDIKGTEAVIEGDGFRGLKEPDNVIDVGNSGTSIRLLTGLLSAQDFISVLTGDSSIRRRPMERVISPMNLMGAKIYARENGTKAPITIIGGKLKPIDYASPVASAQVKSAIILAALQTKGKTTIKEPLLSRNHSEKMLRHYGADISAKGTTVTVTGGKPLHACDFTVPGDFSSAAFMIAAAMIMKSSRLRILNVGINPTRTGFLTALLKMGGRVKIVNKRMSGGEACADIIAENSKLKGINFPASLVPSTIDEFPIFFILAALADGVTTVKRIEELRHKESDRIAGMAEGLRKMGVKVEDGPDWIRIEGTRKLVGTAINANLDHRIAMSFSIAGLIAEGQTTIRGTECIKTSFPGFYEILKNLTGGR
ncbi:MAG: 3-phosphoshikimate 1-carboxyvinyltransferase [Candidatus Schekmanbacteria bacterium]|nr:3-phosphoshikimate 1-carboxyvinyltransferase [Candidatus Schekmanbacteria bacterium]